MIKIRHVVMTICLLVLCLCLSGCGEFYPSIKIFTATFAGTIDISIGNQYEYDDFETLETDSGKDLILHFARKRASK